MKPQRNALAPIVLLSLVCVCWPAVAAVDAPAPEVAAADAATAQEREAEGSETTRIAGRVVAPDGKPVVGARVLAVSHEAKPAKKPRKLFTRRRDKPKPVAVVEATTDDAGRFTVEVEGPAPFMLRVDADGFATGRADEVGAGDAPTIAMTAGFPVRGRVLDKASGKPVIGAEIEAGPARAEGFGDPEHPDRLRVTARTDDRGDFVFEHLEANEYRLVAIADGYTRAIAPPIDVEASKGGASPTYLYLSPGVALEGRVLDGDGTPLAGAEVRVRPERLDMGKVRTWGRTGGLSEKTDDDGRFTLRGIPPAPSYQLEALHDDYAPAWLTGVEVPAGRKSDLLELRLGSGTALSARVVADGKPYAGELRAQLTYLGRGSGQFKPRVSRSPDEIELEAGRLTIDRLPPGKAKLELEADGYLEVERSVTLVADERLDLGDVLLEGGLRITGKVLGDDGEPLEDAKIVLTSIGPGRFESANAKTREDGTFVAGGLEDVAYTVGASAEGYGEMALENVEPDGDALLFELARAGAIRGRVVAGDPPMPVEAFAVTPQGKPAPGVPFQMQAALFNRARMSYRDASGEFLIEGLTADTYTLKVESAGFVDERVEKVEVGAGETTDVGDVTVERGATLRGVVTERGTGRAVGGASVTVEEPGLFNAANFMNLGESAELTDPGGAFSVRGLAPGRHTLKVTHDEYSPGTLEVEVAAGVPPADVVVELGKGGAIEGVYRNAQGKPVDGGMVIAMLGFAPSPDSMTSADANGHFRIDNLTPGTYRLMAMGNPIEAEGDQAALMAGMQMQTVEVEDGKTVMVNIPEQTGGIEVNGVVRQGTRKLAARMFWVRMAADETSAEDFSTAASDESGAFQVRLKQPGEYRVSIQPLDEEQDWGRPGTSVKVEIPADLESVTQDIVIPEITLSGTVLDGETGQPLPDVRIVALEHREDRALAESIGVGSAVTDDQGNYLLEGIAAGEYRLAFSKEGYGYETLGPLDVDDGGEDGLNTALLPATPAHLRVLDESGNPVEGALVFSLSGPAMAAAGATGSSDMNGDVVLNGLTDGSHDLGVLTPGFAPTVAAGVLVQPDIDEPTIVELRRGARLKIRVLDGEERPVSGAAVRVSRERGPDLTPMLQVGAAFRGQGMVTGSDGTLDIPNLEAGRYDVSVRWESASNNEKAQVRLDRDNVVEIELR